MSVVLGAERLSRTIVWVAYGDDGRWWCWSVGGVDEEWWVAPMEVSEVNFCDHHPPTTPISHITPLPLIPLPCVFPSVLCTRFIWTSRHSHGILRVACCAWPQPRAMSMSSARCVQCLALLRRRQDARGEVFQIAVKEGYLEVARALYELPSSRSMMRSAQFEAVPTAAQEGHLAIVRYLCELLSSTRTLEHTAVLPCGGLRGMGIRMSCAIRLG